MELAWRRRMRRSAAGPDDASVDISIRDCVFMKRHGLSVGWEVAGDVQQLRVERVIFKRTTQGIRIKSGRDRGNDGGGFVYKDITMEAEKGARIAYAEVNSQGLVVKAVGGMPVTIGTGVKGSLQ